MPIYHEYDIRGVYPNQINENKVYKIARAFALFLKKKKLVLARDARLSSNKLHDAALEGLLGQGAKVNDIGYSTTPMFYFAIKKLKAHGGLMITASHLSKNYNGIKLCGKNATPISHDTGLKQIEKLTKIKFKEQKKGEIINKSIFKEYKKFVLKSTKKTKLKVVVDTGNMMGFLDGNILADICSIKPLFFKLDGNMPNRSIDTSNPKNLVKLRNKVLIEKADLGIAFDADADRVAFIDDMGVILEPYQVAYLLMKSIPKKSKIIYGLTMPLLIPETARKLKLKPIISKVGRTNIIKLMIKNKAFFGFESSGHYYYKYNYYLDSGILTAIALIKILDKENKKLSKLRIQIPEVNIKEISIKTNDKLKKMKELEKKYYKNSLRISRLDGTTIYHKNYWINFRPSNTENKIRITKEIN